MKTKKIKIKNKFKEYPFSRKRGGQDPNLALVVRSQTQLGSRPEVSNDIVLSPKLDDIKKQLVQAFNDASPDILRQKLLEQMEKLSGKKLTVKNHSDDHSEDQGKNKTRKIIPIKTELSIFINKLDNTIIFPDQILNINKYLQDLINNSSTRTAYNAEIFDDVQMNSLRTTVNETQQGQSSVLFNGYLRRMVAHVEKAIDEYVKTKKGKGKVNDVILNEMIDRATNSMQTARNNPSEASKKYAAKFVNDVAKMIAAKINEINKINGGMEAKIQTPETSEKSTKPTSPEITAASECVKTHMAKYEELQKSSIDLTMENLEASFTEVNKAFECLKTLTNLLRVGAKKSENRTTEAKETSQGTAEAKEDAEVNGTAEAKGILSRSAQAKEDAEAKGTLRKSVEARNPIEGNGLPPVAESKSDDLPSSGFSQKKSRKRITEPVNLSPEAKSESKSSDPQSESKILSLMTFNIYSKNCNRFNEFKIPQELNINYLLTQETNNAADKQTTFNDYPNAVFSGEGSEQVAIYTKEKISDDLVTTINIETEQSLQGPVTRNGIIITTQNGIKIANLHLEGGRFVDKQLLQNFDKIFAHKMKLLNEIIQNDPDIIAGDFNSAYHTENLKNYMDGQFAYFEKIKNENTPEGVAQKTITKDEKEMISKWNVVPFTILKKKKYTYAIPENEKLYTNGRGKSIIDCIWYKKDKLTMTNCKIIELLKSNDVYETTQDGQIDCISDHNPVVAIFTINELDLAAQAKGSAQSSLELKATHGLRSANKNPSDKQSKAEAKSKPTSILQSLTPSTRPNVLTSHENTLKKSALHLGSVTGFGLGGII